ncbi:MAG: sigma-70 family RNA polymerase sigma factor [Bacteroidales bacterium]|nr:sigma-70 family RNA polymerase sigma factor [Bacteroidales bacterium]
MTRSNLLDEQDIASSAAAGNSEAMRQIYCRYAGVLTAAVARYVVDDDAVRDVLHDALVKAFQGIAGFEYRGPGSLRAWLQRIAVNEALAWLRMRKRLDVVSLDDDGVPIDDVAAAADNDDAALDSMERLDAAQLLELMKRLPDGQRTVLNLYAVEHRSHREIAEMLGISPESSAAQLHRARQKMIGMVRSFLDIR